MDNNFDALRAKRMAAEQMGISPEQLEKLGADGILARLSPADREKINSIISDPDAARRLLSTPGAQRLIKSLKKSGDKSNG